MSLALFSASFAHLHFCGRLLNRPAFPADCVATLEEACSSIRERIGIMSATAPPAAMEDAAEEEDDECKAALLPGQDLALLCVVHKRLRTICVT